jgi:hypothetical protein
MTNVARTELAKAFLAKNPTLIVSRYGVDLYEHPTLGDEIELFAITRDGRLKHTDHWEVPSYEDSTDLINL